MASQPEIETTAACMCMTAQARVRAIGGRVTCVLCGSEWAGPVVEPPARPSKPPRVVAPGSDAARERARRFVHALLRWDLCVARVERQARGDASPVLGVIRVLELGVYGTGCDGTKGVGRPPEHDAAEVAVDPDAGARYAALRGAALRVADAILADGQGDQLVTLRFGKREVPCNLPQRLGLRLAAMAQATRWALKMAEGDCRPALAGAEELGQRLLESAASAWFSDIP